MNEPKVHVVYRNSKLMPVADEMYDLAEYTEMIKNDLIRLISDTEDLVYAATNGIPKSDWEDSVWSKFSCIKHKLLDKAGEISRLPNNLVYGGDENG